MSKQLSAQPPGLSGPEGVIMATIARATLDATGRYGADHCLDAWAYLGGPTYRQHVQLLGLPEDAWPKALNDSKTLLKVIALLMDAQKVQRREDAQ